MSSPEELARQQIDALLGRQALADWSSSDKTSSAGEARRVSAGSAHQFHQFVTPNFGRWSPLRKFNFRLSTFHFRNRLTSNHLNPVARVTICTIQRLYAMLRSLFFGMKHGCRKARTTRVDRHAAIFVAQRVAMLH